MRNYELQYKPFGASSILIEWPQQINVFISQNIYDFQFIIENQLKEFVVECIPAYASLAVIYKNIGFESLSEKIKTIYNNGFMKTKKSVTVWQLPVCYHPSLGFDLENFSKSVGLSIEKIIKIHSSESYQIYFIGFLPGFLYLGNLDEHLYLKRKAKPLLKVPKGAVGIGGNQTGIYPQESPGGWHIIGNCPVELFNVNKNPPAVFKAGDIIRFYRLSLKDFNENNFEIIKSKTIA